MVRDQLPIACLSVIFSGILCLRLISMVWFLFAGRGLAEITRYMLSIAGVDFEDFRYPITPDFKRPVFLNHVVVNRTVAFHASDFCY
jgi:hypothetical protein